MLNDSEAHRSITMMCFTIVQHILQKRGFIIAYYLSWAKWIKAQQPNFNVISIQHSILLYPYVICIDKPGVWSASYYNPFKQISNLYPQIRAWRTALASGQQFVFIPKGKGILIMPVPSFEQLKGIAAGADPTNFRDRNERF